MTIKVKAEELLEAGAHFGHQTKRWNPKMASYIYGTQEGVHVFDLIQTKAKLEEALKVITTTVKEGKIVLLVGTKKQAQEKVAEVGKETGIPFVSQRWLGGTLTNFGQMKRSIKKLAEMKAKMVSGEYASFTKKEKLLIEREIARLEKLFGGITMLESIPDLIIIIDTHKEATVVREAKIVGVATVGVCDSNADPTLVDYPIPMNDDASRAINYVLDLIKKAILAGKK